MIQWVFAAIILSSCFLPVMASDSQYPENFYCSSTKNSQEIINRAREEDRGARLLLMSGGGSHGAWGAGFINGWREQGANPLDMITGVSAGAMSATFVYLEDAEGLKNLFLETTTKEFYRKRFPLFALFSDSLYTTKPQKKRLLELFSNDVIDQVALRARGKGHWKTPPPILCIGTVNLNTNTFVQWNLAEIAKAEDYRLYRKVLKAAVAFPVLFPPVELKGGLYTDGGLKENIFVALHDITVHHAINYNTTGTTAGTYPDFTVTSLDEYKKLEQKQQEIALDAAQKILELVKAKPIAYLIFNGKTELEDISWITKKLLPLSKRAMSIMMNQRTQGNLYRLHYDLILKDDDLNIGWDFRYTKIPLTLNVPCNFMAFDPECTKMIYKESHIQGLANKWEEGFPNFAESQ
jgi:predicted patatin/cPLA2 family phospholipase